MCREYNMKNGEFPKIIHQIWMQGEKYIPEKFNNYIKSIKKFNPDWEYNLWDEISILNLLSKNKQHIDTYYKFSYLHQKIDYARYVILYHFGGVSIDIDTECLKSLNGLIEKYKDYSLIVSEANSKFLEKIIICYNVCLNNATIFAKINNLVLFELIKHIDKNNQCPFYKTQSLCIINTTGPKVFSYIINKYKDKVKIKILDKEYLEPCRMDKCDITKQSYLAHRHEQSWNSFLSSVYKLFRDYYIAISIIIFIILIIIIISYIIIKNK